MVFYCYRAERAQRIFLGGVALLGAKVEGRSRCNSWPDNCQPIIIDVLILLYGSARGPCAGADGAPPLALAGRGWELLPVGVLAMRGGQFLCPSPTFKRSCASGLSGVAQALSFLSCVSGGLSLDLLLVSLSLFLFPGGFLLLSG